VVVESARGESFSAMISLVTKSVAERDI